MPCWAITTYHTAIQNGVATLVITQRHLTYHPVAEPLSKCLEQSMSIFAPAMGLMPNDVIQNLYLRDSHIFKYSSQW